MLHNQRQRVTYVVSCINLLLDLELTIGIILDLQEKREIKGMIIS
jgi:hypothetical protein